MKSCRKWRMTNPISINIQRAYFEDVKHAGLKQTDDSIMFVKTKFVHKVLFVFHS